MKYPFHTESKPVSGNAAKELIEAIEAGRSIANARALALAKRIAGNRSRRLKNHAQPR